MFLTYFKTLYTNPTKSLEILATSLGFQNLMFEGFQRNPRISNTDNPANQTQDWKGFEIQIHSIPENQTGPKKIRIGIRCARIRQLRSKKAGKYLAPYPIKQAK